MSSPFEILLVAHHSLGKKDKKDSAAVVVRFCWLFIYRFNWCRKSSKRRTSWFNPRKSHRPSKPANGHCCWKCVFVFVWLFLMGRTMTSWIFALAITPHCPMAALRWSELFKTMFEAVSSTWTSLQTPHLMRYFKPSCLIIKWVLFVCFVLSFSHWANRLLLGLSEFCEWRRLATAALLIPKFESMVRSRLTSLQGHWVLDCLCGESHASGEVPAKRWQGVRVHRSPALCHRIRKASCCYLGEAYWSLVSGH